ncbi:MAG: hypothetical protein ACK4K0_02225 [Flavobacteriales bacterium]
MKKWIEKRLPDNDFERFWKVVVAIAIIALALTLIGIYGFKQYGLAVFVVTPLFIGLGSAILFGLKKGIMFNQSWKIGFLSLTLFILFLLIFGLEGLVCIAMAAPFGFIITWIGSSIGFFIVNKKPKKGPSALFPLTAFIEKNQKPALTSVVTSIEIGADIHTVWKNVIEFPQLDEPTEFIFKTGIAYPIDAKIEGAGVGEIRHCNFTTGSFVEPITVWDEPSLLKFDVVEQPEPMKELSFWDIDAPHLHDYFVSNQGQFKLTKLPGENTLLEGTTWYYHNISPAFYWQFWSDYIIHKIHFRALTHIKKNAEKEAKEN